eukprot:CAMPEP_0171385468 /NCGR_PEP_ID=MMETSP0879-20121228/38999_1 /TAXON_ID=67004 /ORGANISM="Thalassiosira weissflogii, Strain CCMP1336" /LENGTH=1074 /DNA_ID=CAMNT_0011897767 /DNA_START=57 /DNA_END=3277 /DNA_ORIENTATION=-
MSSGSPSSSHQRTFPPLPLSTIPPRRKSTSTTSSEDARSHRMKTLLRIPDSLEDSDTLTPTAAMKRQASSTSCTSSSCHSKSSSTGRRSAHSSGTRGTTSSHSTVARSNIDHQQHRSALHGFFNVGNLHNLHKLSGAGGAAGTDGRRHHQLIPSGLSVASSSANSSGSGLDSERRGVFLGCGNVNGNGNGSGSGSVGENSKYSRCSHKTEETDESVNRWVRKHFEAEESIPIPSSGHGHGHGHGHGPNGQHCENGGGGNDAHAVRVMHAHESNNRHSPEQQDFSYGDGGSSSSRRRSSLSSSSANKIIELLAVITDNFLPPRLRSHAHQSSSHHGGYDSNNAHHAQSSRHSQHPPLHHNSFDSNSLYSNEKRRRIGFLPFLLLSLIIYGSISMIMDVYRSVYHTIQLTQVQKSMQLYREERDRFPGGFGSVDGAHQDPSLPLQQQQQQQQERGAEGIAAAHESSRTNNNNNNNNNNKSGGAEGIAAAHESSRTILSSLQSGSFLSSLRQGNQHPPEDAAASTSSSIMGLASSLLPRARSMGLDTDGSAGDASYAPVNDYYDANISGQDTTTSRETNASVDPSSFIDYQDVSLIDRNNPTLHDVPLLTNHILSTTFRHALDNNDHNTLQNDQFSSSSPYPNEILFFWSVGGFPGRGPFQAIPSHFQKCFPNVVQAAGGTDRHHHNLLPEDEWRQFPNELRILQTMVPVASNTAEGEASPRYDGNGMEIKRRGGKYVNVDLFTPEGVMRAADLNMLFPDHLYPVVGEHESVVVSEERKKRLRERLMQEQQQGQHGEDIVTVDNHSQGDARSIMASNQIQFLFSPFLPEISMGLFTPPSSTSTTNTDLDQILKTIPHPKARIHGVFLPSEMRIRHYHEHYKTSHNLGTYLQFITSSSIVVENYMTRILTGQWEEGTPVTEAHLKIAKNIISSKVTLWPTRGLDDMQKHWVEWYRWQEGALGFHRDLVREFGDDDLDIRNLVLGMDCLFPPAPSSPSVELREVPDGMKLVELETGGKVIVDKFGKVVETVEEPPPPPKPKVKREMSDLEREVDAILKERNALDQKLFNYAVELYNARK